MLQLSRFQDHLHLKLFGAHQKTLHWGGRGGEKVFQIFQVYRWHFAAPATFLRFVLSGSHIVSARLPGMQRDLLCNPMKVVVSGKVLFVPGGREMGQLKGLSVQGLGGD